MKLGRFDIDYDQRCLLLDGKVVPLGVRAFDILAALVGAEGRTVSRAELMETVWPNVIVEDCNIDQHVCALRKALGADRHLIVTVARRGYRCAMAPVAPAPRTIAPSGPNTNAPTRLPLRRTLRGREAAVAAIAALVQRSPLVTLTGTGGIGKTSLAIEIAHELAGQSCVRVDFVDLGEAHDERAVLLAIAQGCELNMDGIDCASGALAVALAGVPRLVVLDGAEQVACSVAAIVEGLLASNDALRFLVTSREPLQVRAESLFKVEPLDIPRAHEDDASIEASPAVQLFLQHARLSSCEAGRHAQELRAIGEICRRLDGVPLAIELAALRSAALGIEGVRRRLDDRLALLTGGFRNATPRHRTLRAMLDASFTLLSETAQQLFERLSRFTQPFTFEAICADVCDARISEACLIDGISELITKSLVDVQLEGGQANYRMLESTRVYAAERLRIRLSQGQQNTDFTNALPLLKAA